ncbi:MAG TPA: sulfotransferase [Xanthomonadales bacterium]|nr:sulfotransferase [Xanthomonadales bacterium]
MNQKSDRIDVPGGLYWQSRFFNSTSGFWRWMGDLETKAVADEIESVTVESPVYVTSLARAGTTIVTEMLESHPALTCHHYSDFPNPWTPFWRNYLLQKSRREPPVPSVRAHRDRIMVSQDSPEAVEEVLWMAFFENLHDPSRINVLDENDGHKRFDKFYTDHIRKLLAVRKAKRYLAKGNYNISRLAYLQRLFSNARFLVPIRQPEHHIASLIKQHTLFSRASKLDPRVGKQLGMSGHFEFGPDRRQVNFGDQEANTAIESAWQKGNEVEGWARYWAATYQFLCTQLESHQELSDQCLLFRYEDLCAQSEAVIDQILDHCDLDKASFSDSRKHFSSRLTLPDYYKPEFTSAEQIEIEQHCHPVYRRLEQHIRQFENHTSG